MRKPGLSVKDAGRRGSSAAASGGHGDLLAGDAVGPAVAVSCGLRLFLPSSRHEERSGLRASRRDADPERCEASQGGAPGPRPHALRPPGMKGDGSAVWGLMWKYCISVRTLRYGASVQGRWWGCARLGGQERLFWRGAGVPRARWGGTVPARYSVHRAPAFVL